MGKGPEMGYETTLGTLAMSNNTALQAMQMCFKQMSETQKNLAEMYAKQQQVRQEQSKVQFAQATDELAQAAESEKAQIIEATTQKVTVPLVEDGVDDGKIGAGAALKNAGKGIFKNIKGMFCDENGFSLKRTATTLAVGAGVTALCVLTGGAATPFVVGAGLALGAAQTAKGAVNAATAKTDAEAEQAWQDIGAGAFNTAAAAVGAKGALGKSAPTGRFSTVKASKDCLVQSYKGVKKVVTKPSEALADVQGVYNNTAKPQFKKYFSKENALENTRKRTAAKYDKEITKLEESYKKLSDEISALDKVKDKAKIDNKIAEQSKIAEEIANKKIMQNEINAQYAPETDNLAFIKNKNSVERFYELNAKIKKGVKLEELTAEEQNLLKALLPNKDTKIKGLDNSRQDYMNAIADKITEYHTYIRNPQTSSMYARRNVVNEYKALYENNKKIIADKSSSKSDIASAKAQNKEIASHVKNMDKLLKIEEAQFRAQKTEATIKAKKIEQTRAQKALEQAQKAYDEALTNAAAEGVTEAQTAAVKTALEKLNSAKTEEANISTLVSNLEKALASTNAKITTLNGKDIIFNKTAAITSIPGLKSAAAANGGLYGVENNVPEQTEVTQTAPEQAEYLKEWEAKYTKMAQQLQQNFESSQKQTVTNPFLTNMMSSNGLDNWAFYKPAF